MKMSRPAATAILRNILRYSQQTLIVNPPLCCGSALRAMHTSEARLHREGTLAERREEKFRKKQEVALFNELAEVREAKDKETFMKAIQIYEKKQAVYKRGHVDFIMGALEEMKDFEVHKDIEVYKALMEVFPEGEMVPKNIIQSEFMHYPRQQNTAMEILVSMSNNGVVPDDDMGGIIISRFGKNSYVMKRYSRMMYWMPKFKHMNPYPVPWRLPRSNMELAVLALQRMAVDKLNEVHVYDASDLEASNDDTFIASAISPSQKELIAKHNPKRPLFVEGGYLVWLKEHSFVYFILRADPRPELEEYQKRLDEEDKEDVSSGFFSYIGADDEEKRKRTELLAEPSIHEQPEGIILSMCITGSSSKDSLVSWIKFLQEENPSLAEVPIVFSLRTPESGLQPADFTAAPEEPENIEAGPS